MTLQDQLTAFANKQGFQGKGPLCVALVVTDHARQSGLPLDPTNLITDGGGQVLGLGKGKVQGILKRHGINRVLANEGGRTSRGSLGNMKVYIALLNTLSSQSSPALDLDQIERFWIARVQAFFSAKPFMLRMDGSLGLRAVLRSLMAQAEARQKDMPGTMFLGTLMQHMVGAKLDLVLGPAVIRHNGANTNDETSGRAGDFDIADVSIHVSSAPGEALIRKCVANLDAGRRPIIVTTRRGTSTAEGLAENAGILDRLDLLEFEQFIATNLYERACFAANKRRQTIMDLVAGYNTIVDTHETDPSLRIEIAQGR